LNPLRPGPMILGTGLAGGLPVPNIKNRGIDMATYNSKYKIRFEWNPRMQCITGQFEGWRMVLEAYVNSREIRRDDEVLFNHNSQSKWNALVRHIKKMENGREGT